MAAILGGCLQPEPSQTLLQLRLNDSLSRYDSITITLLKLADTNQVLQTVHTGKMNNPAALPPFKLTAARDVPFMVKIRGWIRGGQLGLETLIYYEGDSKVVKYMPVPPLVVRNSLGLLTASAGTFIPPFHKDSLHYRLIVPLGIDSVTLAALPAHPEAKVVLNGDPSHPLPRSFHPSATPQTVLISVVDLGAKKDYEVIIQEEVPAKVGLTSLVLTAGSLTPAFSTEVNNYTTIIPADVSTVRVIATPADSRTMTLTIQGRAAFPGQPSDPFTMNPGQIRMVTILVARGDERAEYSVSIFRPSSQAESPPQ